jgi:pyridoxine kinase
MGDYKEGLYVKADIPDFYKEEALPRASILKPNQFEAELLSGIPIHDLSSAKRACSILHDKGPSIVLITSVDAIYGSDESICSVLSLRDRISGKDNGYSIRSPRFSFAIPPHGAGDLTCALFLGYYLESADPILAFERTMTAVHRVFERTHASQGRELEIVASQDAFAVREVLFPCSHLW